MSIKIEVISETFQAIAPHADEVMAHFYDTLFKTYPQATSMFENVDMAKQRKALALSIGHVIEYWKNQEHVIDYLKKMGARHSKLNVEPEHFEWVGNSLLSTLAFFFDDSWTGEIQKEWIGFYGYISKNMIAGLEAAKKQSAPILVKNNTEIFKTLIPENYQSRSLDDVARSMAKNLLKHALTEEAGDAFLQIARDKVKSILRKAMEEEVKELTQNIKKKAA